MRRFIGLAAGMSVGVFGLTATSAAPVIDPPGGAGGGHDAPAKPKGKKAGAKPEAAAPAAAKGPEHHEEAGGKGEGKAGAAEPSENEHGGEQGGGEGAKAGGAPDETEHAAATMAALIEKKEITAGEALKLLEEGNARWVAGKGEHPNTETARREELATNGQHPFVTVLTCADSRLPVERLFDRGVGDVFVARVAGAVAADGETGTIEYGVGHLKTPLLVVMGHTKCGAVGAAVSGAEVHGSVAGLIEAIEPAVARAKRNNPGVEGEALAAAAVKENVWQAVFDLLKRSPEMRGMVQKGEVMVVGAVCDVSTGKVSFMGEHPWQAELMAAMEKEAAGAAVAGAPEGD